MIDVNIRGRASWHRRCICRSFAQPDRVHFVNVSSVSGLQVAPNPRRSISGTKFRGPSDFRGPFGRKPAARFRVTTICPGAVETEPPLKTISNPDLKKRINAFSGDCNSHPATIAPRDRILPSSRPAGYRRQRNRGSAQPHSRHRHQQSVSTTGARR